MMAKTQTASSQRTTTYTTCQSFGLRSQASIAVQKEDIPQRKDLNVKTHSPLFTTPTEPQDHLLDFPFRLSRLIRFQSWSSQWSQSSPRITQHRPRHRVHPALMVMTTIFRTCPQVTMSVDLCSLAAQSALLLLPLTQARRRPALESSCTVSELHPPLSEPCQTLLLF